MKYSFASLEGNWEYPEFDTKEEAIQAGKLEFEEEEFLVGKLKPVERLEYQVVKVEEVNKRPNSLYERLLKNLVVKCYENNLSIDVGGGRFGSVNVWDHEEDAIRVLVTYGATKSVIRETREDALIRIHKEVFAYIREKENRNQEVEYDELDAEFTDEKFATGPITPQEIAMKEAGHKLSDFE